MDQKREGGGEMRFADKGKNYGRHLTTQAGGKKGGVLTRSASDSVST